MSIESRSKQYGHVFGDWHIGRRLDNGSNSKSAVFELYRESNGWVERSALKVVSLIEERGQEEALPPHRRMEYTTTVKEQRSRAEQEVRLMEQLRGKTNVVDYLDHSFFDWHDEYGFGVDLLIRMELLTDLRSDMRAGRLFRDSEILKIGQDICSALVLCHGKSIIHRDIKPENIFYNSDGDFKLGDFGISRIMESSTSAMVSTGVGTPAYSAPEQHSGAYDQRVDIYSLGLVLYELCNGNRLPFTASSYISEQEIQLRLSGAPLPYPSRQPSSNPFLTTPATGTASPSDPFLTVSAAGADDPYKTSAALPESESASLYTEKLIPIVMKACAFRPEDRFATAQEMLDALRAEQKEPYTPPVPPPNPAPPKPFNKLLGVILACAAVLVLGVLFFTLRDRLEKSEQVSGEVAEDVDAQESPQPSSDSEAAVLEPLWSAPVYSWAEDNSYVTARRTNQHNSSESENETVYTSSRVTRPATCTESGETTYTAEFTNTAFQTQSNTLTNIAPLGHNWDKWVTVTAATCTQSGQEKRVCKNDPTHSEEREIPALGHDWQPSTNSSSDICSRCGAQAEEALSMSEYSGALSRLTRLSFSRASASSELWDPEYGSFPASLAIDSDISTSWQEGVTGDGKGENLTIFFDQATEVSVLQLYTGFTMSEYTYQANSRPRELRFDFSDGSSCSYTLSDRIDSTIVALSKPVTTSYITITIVDTFPGEWLDTAISEVYAFQEEESVAVSLPNTDVANTLLMSEANKKITLNKYSGDLASFERVLFSEATASSIYSEGTGLTYYPTSIIQNDATWPWVEGSSGDGTGEYVVLSFSNSETIDLLGLHLGFSSVYSANNRPRLLQFDFSDGTSAQYEFEDLNQMQYVRLNHPVSTRFVRITILSVYPGYLENDACITSVRAYRSK